MSDAPTRHVIEIDEVGDRAYWQCDCGHGGSSAASHAEEHAEEHIPDGEGASYRYRAVGQ